MRREWFIVSLLALVGAFVMTRGLVHYPTYTDAYYHYNAAQHLVNGKGLTDSYIWTYLGQPEPKTIPVLETPSHLYWMPLTSLLAAFGLTFFGGTYAAAQFPFTLLYIATIILAYWLGYKLGGSRRHAIVAALLTLFSGFFVNGWGAIDTFAPYAFFGALCLVALGQGLEQYGQRYTGWWFVLAGITAGLGHLTRSDGLLLLIVAWMVLLSPFWKAPGTQLTVPPEARLRFLLAVTLGYLLIMGGWFIRMNQITGSILPVGGLQAVWFTEYNDLFRYPPDSSTQRFFGNGIGLLLTTRWEAFINNLQTLIAVEGLIVMFPLMLVGLWKRRGSFTAAFILYVIGIHLAMTFVFPYPGYRGGLFHSASALIAWWSALGVVGLDESVDWVAKRRRRWKPRTAKLVFSAGLVMMALLLVALVARPPAPETNPYADLPLPPDARLLINDPAALYYYTGRGGAVLPNSDPSVIPEIAARYDLSYLLIEDIEMVDGQVMGAAVTTPLLSILEQPPDFLEPVPLDREDMRLYRIHGEN